MVSLGLTSKTSSYVQQLCDVRPNRTTGSDGNKQATAWFATTLRDSGIEVQTPTFDCLDFDQGEGSIQTPGGKIDLTPSPFSHGCSISAPLRVVTSIDELEECSCRGELLLLMGSICFEQLMPKNFVFYNPEHHQTIYALLESKKPGAIITATGRNPELAGSMYPFPMIEDGDFEIPSVYCTDVLGEKIAGFAGQTCTLVSTARRFPSKASNVIGRINPQVSDRIVVCAHIDAKDNSPGALDNATGTTVLLLLAKLLVQTSTKKGVDLVAFNGEDYYSAGGQMNYLQNEDLKKVRVAINMDGVGYKEGKTAYSFYNCDDKLTERARRSFGAYGGLLEGEPWYQGDHMCFVQNNRPAIAITSEKFTYLCEKITHTPNDSPDKVEFSKLEELALALEKLIEEITF